MTGLQFDVVLSVQLAFLAKIRSKFNLVGYAGPELLVFTLAWLLSDLAVLAYLLELAITKYRTGNLSMKSEKTQANSKSHKSEAMYNVVPPGAVAAQPVQLIELPCVFIFENGKFVNSTNCSSPIYSAIAPINPRHHFSEKPV